MHQLADTDTFTMTLYDIVPQESHVTLQLTNKTQEEKLVSFRHLSIFVPELNPPTPADTHKTFDA
jgi:hypothetical protein